LCLSQGTRQSRTRTCSIDYLRFSRHLLLTCPLVESSTWWILNVSWLFERTSKSSNWELVGDLHFTTRGIYWLKGGFSWMVIQTHWPSSVCCKCRLAVSHCATIVDNYIPADRRCLRSLIQQLHAHFWVINLQYLFRLESMCRSSCPCRFNWLISLGCNSFLNCFIVYSRWHMAFFADVFVYLSRNVTLLRLFMPG
jgi:hypothetical protein